MKKFYILLAALSLTTVAATAQQNLIVNGNFENWTAANPENFEKVGTTVFYNDLITKETTISRSGNAVKQQSKPQGSTQYLEYGDLIPVTAGVSYTISYWYLDNSTQARTRLWSSWLDASNTALGTTLQSAIQEATYSTDSPNWVNKVVTVVAPAGATAIRYQIREYHQDNTAGGFIYYDDLSFGPTATAGVGEFGISGLKLFPNPLTGTQLNIASDSNADKAVVIYDVLGKQVLSTTVTAGAVNVAGLNAGIYIVKVTEEGKTATRKLVIK